MNLMRFKYIYFLISGMVLIPGIISLALFGLKPSVDFVGGAILECRIKNEELRINFENNESEIIDKYDLKDIQESGDGQFVIKTSQISELEKDELIKNLNENYGEIEELRFETVGPIMGRELIIKTLTALAIVAGMITIYVWKQFNDLKFGVCAILAMFHDSLVLLGSFSLLGHFFGTEVDVLFVTALLTTLSFSVHDTIVVYDRIRELRRQHRRYSFETIVNAAVLQTLSRSINNSVTIILMLLSLTVLGGDTIRNFALALLIGAITGTYSSTFTAAPLLLFWNEMSSKRKGS